MKLCYLPPGFEVDSVQRSLFINLKYLQNRFCLYLRTGVCALVPTIVLWGVSSVVPFHWLTPIAQAQELRVTRVASAVGNKPKIVVEYEAHPAAQVVDNYMCTAVDDFIETFGERIPLWALGELRPGTVFYVRLVRLDDPKSGLIVLRATLLEFSSDRRSGLERNTPLRIDLPYIEYGLDLTPQALSERLQGQLLKRWLPLRDVAPESRFWLLPLWMKNYGDQLDSILVHKELVESSPVVGPPPDFMNWMLQRFLRLVRQLEAEAQTDAPDVTARALAVIRRDPYVRERWIADHWYVVAGKFLDLVAQVSGHVARWSARGLGSFGGNSALARLAAPPVLSYPKNDPLLNLRSALEAQGWYGFVRQWFQVPAEGMTSGGEPERRMSAYAMLVPDFDRRYPVGDFSLIAHETLFEQSRPTPQTLIPNGGSSRITRERLTGLNGYVSDAFRNILRRLAGSAFDGALSLVSVEWLFMGDGSLMAARVRVRLELGEWTSGVHRAGAYRALPIESGPRSGTYDLWVSNLADPTLHNLPWPDLLHTLELEE